ncbi:MAG TPA: hypothetical protein VFM15_08320 [Gammaproteobacteria bacterium]|nr:hypothetical protein [Gammaproteobacteria bacterium]
MTTDRALTLFAAVAAHHGESWSFNPAPKFGANALRVNGKIYAALTRKHQLLLKLPPARVTELLAAKRAQRMQSGGRIMHGWITLAPSRKTEWIALSVEARAFVSAETMRKGKSR